MHAAYARPEVVARVRRPLRRRRARPRTAPSTGRCSARARSRRRAAWRRSRRSSIRSWAVAREEWVAARRAETRPRRCWSARCRSSTRSGLEGLFDAVLVVTASDDVRRARVEARGQDFAARAARQLPEADKVARADAAFVNDGDRAELRAWVADRFAEYAGRSLHGPPVVTERASRTGRRPSAACRPRRAGGRAAGAAGAGPARSRCSCARRVRDRLVRGPPGDAGLVRPPLVPAALRGADPRRRRRATASTRRSWRRSSTPRAASRPTRAPAQGAVGPDAAPARDGAVRRGASRTGRARRPTRSRRPR